MSRELKQTREAVPFCNEFGEITYPFTKEEQKAALDYAYEVWGDETNEMFHMSYCAFLRGIYYAKTNKSNYDTSWL